MSDLQTLAEKSLEVLRSKLILMKPFKSLSLDQRTPEMCLAAMKQNIKKVACHLTVPQLSQEVLHPLLNEHWDDVINSISDKKAVALAARFASVEDVERERMRA